MKKLLLVFVIGFIGAVRSHADKHIELEYSDHVSRLLNPRHPTINEGKAWKDARVYIRERFFKESLTIKIQKYSTTISSANDEEVEVSGENIIGISEGNTAGKDQVIVVAADYDTMQAPTSAVSNNGAGVASLIEIARVYNGLTRTPDFAANYTVIFVAFDLNTREHYPSKGTPGAEKFVREWLMPYINNDTSRFRGAIILDEITNYSLEDDTQRPYPGSDKYFPGVNARIEEDDNKGDFLAMITHWTDTDDDLAAAFSGHYNMKRRQHPYRLQEMRLAKPAPNDRLFGDLIEVIGKSSQYPFWANDLPAILLTDTGYYRTDACLSKCRPRDFVSGDRKEFMDTTNYAIIQTLLNLQTTHLIYDGGNGAASTMSYLMTVLLAVLAGAFLR